MAQKSFNQDGYVEVADRIREFRDKFPQGSLQQLSLEFVQVAGKDWVVYTAAAYRSPDDARPGIGTAWEPIPGLTPFTKNSEVMVAETSAWGRAMVAALAVDAKKIASANEVLNRQVVDEPATDWKPLIAALTTKEAARELYAQARAQKASTGLLKAIEDKAATLA